jgi:hypothetical protein
MRAAIARAATGSSPRISARAAANSATASRSVQSGIGCANSAHRRLVVVGEVSVGLAGRDRAGAGQGERRERAGMVERGDLGDHPADADPREVRGPAAERVGKGRRVGGEVAQGVAGASGSAVVDSPLSRRS